METLLKNENSSMRAWMYEFIHLSIHSFNKYEMGFHCVLGTTLGIQAAIRHSTYPGEAYSVEKKGEFNVTIAIM